MFLLNTNTGVHKAYEEWCLDVFDLYITQDVFDNLVECDEFGEVL